jgi:hypothetical protein
MPIWIETQHNELAEITFIQRPIFDETEDGQNEAPGWKIYGMGIEGRFTLLGVYESKERAEKVIDMVRRNIWKSIQVFPMPKD